MSGRKVNSYGGKCKACGGWVEPQAGTRAPRPVGKLDNGQPDWDTQHNVCPVVEAATQIVGGSFTLTPEQEHILALFQAGKNIVVQAGAGTGKTATQVELAKSTKRIGQYLAFNRSIVDEASKKFPNTVTVMTVDQLALNSPQGRRYRKTLDQSRGKNAVKRAPTNLSISRSLDVEAHVISGDKKITPRVLVGRAKAAVFAYCQTADDKLSHTHVERLDGVTDDEHKLYTGAVLPIARQLWRRWQDPANEWTAGATIIFSVVKKLWQLSKPEIHVDYILFDEAQDASGVMIDVIAHNLSLGKQVVIVGDTQQSINEWMGAIDALPKFEALGCEVAWLTKSFRFGQKVADVANIILAQLDAKLRIVGNEALDSQVTDVDDADVIQTRTNAGAVRMMIEQIKLGRKVHLAGRNFAEELLALAHAFDELAAGGRTEHPELAAFGSWAEVREHANEDPTAGQLKLWVKLIDEVGSAVIIDAIETTVSAKDADVEITTTHKAKGMEWGKVLIAGDFWPPKDGEEIDPAELKLAYVAVTRAQEALDISRVPHFLR
jgi:hypothetical protein